MHSLTVRVFKKLLEQHFNAQISTLSVRNEDGAEGGVEYAHRRGVVAFIEFDSDEEYVAPSVMSSIANRLGISQQAMAAAAESVALMPED